MTDKTDVPGPGEATGPAANTAAPATAVTAVDPSDGKVVRQDVPKPLEWDGVGAFGPGAFVHNTHPGYAGWDDAGLLEKAVDITKEPTAKGKR